MNDKRNKLTVHATKKYKKRKLTDIKKIAIHHSATIQGSAEAFARYHVNQLGWPGIGYHYVINKDGSIDQCHDLEVKSYHVGNSNQFAVGICLVGDFTKEKPTEKQYQSAIQLTKELLNDLNLTESDVLGHNQFVGYSSKPCPSIDMNAFRNDLKDNPIYRVFVDGEQVFALRDKENIIWQLDTHIGTAKEIRLERI